MKITKISKIALLLGLITAACSSHAQVSAGKSEIAFSGSYSALDAGGIDVDVLAINASYGYFITDPLQISVVAGLLDADLGGLDIKAKSLGAGVDYHFNTANKFVPYVGGKLSWLDVDLGGMSDDDWSWQVQAGIKHFVADNVAIKYEVSYMEFDDLDLDGFTFGVGLSFFF